MPPKEKITREMILDAALRIVRERGHESLNARAVAQALRCSTQPVLYRFATMNELREAVYRAADELHTAFIMPKGGEENPMLELGLNYVRFGHEERNLFRFLFQTDKFGGMDIAAILGDPGLSGILAVMAAGLGVSTDEAREMFLTFFAAAHGMASLLANNAMAYEEERCAAMLKNVFRGMIASRRGEENEKTV